MSTPFVPFRHRTLILVGITVGVILFLLYGPLPTQLAFKQIASAQQSPTGATLKICLRLPDESPFNGSVNIRVIPTEGYEVTGFPTESAGEMLFRDVGSGTYSIEASAPGFLTVRRTTQIRPGGGIQTVFIIMKVKPLPPRAGGDPTPGMSPSADRGAGAENTSWIPSDLDDSVPEVDRSVECPLPTVLHGIGVRMEQFVANLEKFSATEQVEHFRVDPNGVRGAPEARSFEYVVTISHNSKGLFILDEYRNGSVNQEQFPAKIATLGLPAMAMVFHPVLVPDFTFKCEGLGSWAGRPAWQVHFEQRPDRPSRIRSYGIQGRHYPVPLKGRAWIDPGTSQVVRLESALVKPLKEIDLTQEYFSISYAAVRFRSSTQQLWLPQVADLYVERQGRRYYRRHTFSNFKIFTVETAQVVQAPKESYSFTNTSDQAIPGSLTVAPASELTLNSVSINFTIPPNSTIYKVVGPGKDVSMPADSVGSATFAYDGPAGIVKVDAYLIKESTLDVVANSATATKQ
jgi:hypothetical protein